MSERIKGPYKHDCHGRVLAGEKGFFFAEVRGWGALTGRGGGMGLSEDQAVAIQGANLQFLVDALNEKEAREKTK